ncbi:BrnT family toxin [Patescibacteria group bacterium]|nr:BrnT family toxin [Patescibacteria group bacterium]MCG2702360.1 BrnT family toxin [Candidatus Parcubacteria bacterium]MBU4264950.1 BrnT family toxin [Patescibacteria group bacterium]MBU4389787.1 BrnT family toxin [Patescibacteria group bacterium]MBU4396885.1 BrnT family toxin [Patescibacteria group bacterium]
MIEHFDVLRVDGFDWDEGNLRKNKVKHNVEIEECQEVVFDEPIYFFDEKHSQKEERFIGYGLTNRKRYLIIVFTIRRNKIRIISARDQNKKERRIYEKNKKNTKI